MRRALRAYPALLRLGFAEAVAYRAEFVIWMLTTTMPLVMLALWTAVSREAPVGPYGTAEFVAYYLGAYIVRTVTGSWVVWEMNHEIRTGTLSMRLLRPVHPFVAYSAEHLASIPLRALMALPFATIMLVATRGARLVDDPLQLAALPLVFALTWIITFLTGVVIGSLGLFIEKSIAVFEVWLGAYAVLSGYLIPLDLMPGWVTRLAAYLPFRYMLGFPVELLIGMSSRVELAKGLAMQAGWVIALLFLARAVWRAGLRRFEAYGA